jgi:hypothetical protein
MPACMYPLPLHTAGSLSRSNYAAGLALHSYSLKLACIVQSMRCTGTKEDELERVDCAGQFPFAVHVWVCCGVREFWCVSCVLQFSFFLLIKAYR